MCLSSLQQSGWLLALTAWHTARNLARGKKCYSNIFTGKLAFAFTGGELFNGPGPACLVPLPSCDTPVPKKDSFSGAFDKYLCLILKLWPDASNGLATEQESLACLLERNAVRLSCYDCHLEKGKDKPERWWFFSKQWQSWGYDPSPPQNADNR